MSPEQFRPYKSDDFPVIAPWFSELGRFYDGHEEGKFVYQLIDKEGADPLGYFTKYKELYLIEGCEGPLGLICLNYKRGGSVKLGPIIVSSNVRGKGVGTKLTEMAMEKAEASGQRKVYATTSDQNLSARHILESLGFEIEAAYPNHYKFGSTELVYGKFLKNGLNLSGQVDLTDDIVKCPSAIVPTEADSVTVIPYSDAHRQQLESLVLPILINWHDELDGSFIDGMVKGHQRGLDFEQKGKRILVGTTDSGKICAMATLVPKRGNPCKLYPLLGSVEAQDLLILEAEQIAKSLGSHKIYTFSAEFDTAEQDFLRSRNFAYRGTIREPYKPAVNLVCFDMFIN